MAASSGGDVSLVPARSSLSSSLSKHVEHLQPLAVHKVRWFYQEDDKWIAFNGADSLVIEKSFRYFKEVENSEDVDLTSVICTTVRGSLYEADVLDRECRPIFWRENAVPIKRGTWFNAAVAGKWEPLDENESTLIEQAHMQLLNSLGLGASSSPSTAQNNIIHQIKIESNRIEWRDISEVYMVSESAGSRLVQKIGFRGARRLNRGYEIDADEKDCMCPITHIVFLVHGIGQLYYGGGGIVNSRKKFMKTLKKTEADINIDGGRVEFFPIEWRTKLKLDEGIIDSITPENLGGLRKMLNATTMDVLYYASPLYREEIIQTLREKLNFVYKQFCDRNPYFKCKNGKVSIIAHSLGSVIIHDLLTLWNSYLLEKDKGNADDNVASERNSWWNWRSITRRASKADLKNKVDLKINVSPTEKVTSDLREQLHNARLKVNELEAQLNSVNQSRYYLDKDDPYSLLFRVENVFNIGSPLGVFLVMRGIRPRDDLEQHLLPTSVCKRTLNIYDPSDPIAYRLEPLIYTHYSAIPPVRLSRINSTTNLLMSSSSPSSSPSSTTFIGKGAWLKSFFASKTPALKADVSYNTESTDDMVIESKESAMEDILREKRVLNHRIDYVLEASLVEYFSAITSHQGYWHSADFTKFVLQVILTPTRDKAVFVGSML